MLAGGEKSRVDTRTTAMLKARMKDSYGLRDCRIGDISPRGLLGICERPPVRGDIVDISVGRHHLVGEVRWVSGRRFGIRSQQRIDVRAVLGQSGSQRRAPRSGGAVVDEDGQWTPLSLAIAYGVLGLTAFSTAYLIVTYLVL